jgi:Leucine-rich repeat (LRR) protein
MGCDYSKVKKLDLSNQDLTKLPDLSKYTNLIILDCSY